MNNKLCNKRCAKSKQIENNNSYYLDINHFNRDILTRENLL